MKRGYVVSGVVLAFAFLSLASTSAARAEGKTPAKTARAWTLDEALAQLALNPKDVYLQYVALQLGREENRFLEATAKIEEWRFRPNWRTGRRNEVDLFSIFTGALAVQESLQLDTMRGETPGVAADDTPSPDAPPRVSRPESTDQRKAELERRKAQTVEVAKLEGPTIKSHPWEAMLGGRKPAVSPLAQAVPDDFYFIEFRSLTKLVEAIDVSDLWGTHVFNQAARDAQTQMIGQRIKAQLAVETDPLTRPFYDMVVEDVAVAGSDLFLREGSDVTLLFRAKQPEVFKLRMDSFLANAEKSNPGAKRSTGRYLDVDYVELATPDRTLSVFSAYPTPELHVRSNSEVAFRRILEAIRGKTAEGHAVRRLGDTDEFKYIRTLMPRGAKEEDGFAYLSDPFIRRMVGPQVKLTERRRMLCYNHLRMIGHGAMLYRTQFGRNPKSLAEMAEANCAPGVFGEKQLACPDGGKYTLSADGAAGVCSRHGTAHLLTPCCEIPVAKVNGLEADQYKAFLTEYNQYWRTYFDPIGIRIQIGPKRYRLETIVLPLIDNSIYTGLAMSLGGKPEPLDALPVPKRNIFTVAVRLNKEALLKGVPEIERDLTYNFFVGPGASREMVDGLNIREFVNRGLGNQVTMNVYDAAPMFDFNLVGALGQAAGSFNVRGGGFGNEILPISFLIASFNAPVYLAIPIQDGKVVDDFMARLDTLSAALARRGSSGGWFDFDQDYYAISGGRPDQKIRCHAVEIGPLKWRFFWTRIDNAIYIASKKFIIDDLAAAKAPDAKDKKADSGPVAHAMVRVRPQNWKEVLPDFQLGWAENNREACLNNLGPLSSVARSLAALDSDKGDGKNAAAAKLGAKVHDEADRLHAVHFFCPEGGEYLLSADGKAITCSVHGSAMAPTQPVAPATNTGPGSLLYGLNGVTAELTFLEDGLHAVMTIDRK
ncbi:MAG: hypothetical protein ACYC35_24170 [Pirellulales bacterium]